MISDNALDLLRKLLIKELNLTNARIVEKMEERPPVSDQWIRDQRHYAHRLRLAKDEVEEEWDAR